MPSGPGDVLDLIRHGRATTRGDVLEATGLSRMTISQRLDALLAAGMIVEGEHQRGHRWSAPPQPGLQHLPVPRARGRHRHHAHPDRRDRPGRSGPGRGLDRRRRSAPAPPRCSTGSSVAMGAVLGKQGLDADDLCGLGLSLPGPVDPVSGRPSQPPMLPGWDAYPVARAPAARAPRRPGADGERRGRRRDGRVRRGNTHVESLCLVKVSTGIGTGIVIGGRSYSGCRRRRRRHRARPGLAPVRGAVRSAACRAAWRPWPAAAPLPRSCGSLGFEAASGRDVRALLQAGEPEAARLTQAAGKRIGEVLATMVCLLNPEVVLVGRRPGLGPPARRHARDALPPRAPARDPAHGPPAGQPRRGRRRGRDDAPGRRPGVLPRHRQREASRLGFSPTPAPRRPRHRRRPARDQLLVHAAAGRAALRGARPRRCRGW